MMTGALWNQPAGRELDSTPLGDAATPTRIVACLNVWNDANALRTTMRLWAPYVDHIIAVDGAYDTTDAGLSTDGTRDILSSFPHVTLINAPGLTQCEKRTKYLEVGREGDYLFIVDADEEVADGAVLRSLPALDVGWIRMKNTLYVREYGQPRIIRWRPGLHYKGRHHWIYHNDALLCTHQYSGPGYMHRPVPLHMSNQRQLGRSAERLAAKRDHLAKQTAVEVQVSAMRRSIMSDTKIGGREALQILNVAYRDDGLAPSRFHTAINRTTPHSSVFFKSRPGPFEVPNQYSSRMHGAMLTQASQSADILHYHGVMSMAYRTATTLPTVFHHHGSMLRANAPTYNMQAQTRGALVLVSNLELLSWTDDLAAKFLPNPVPVARYRMLADELRTPFTGYNTFRVAHSPSHPKRKGTEFFLAACARLQAKGIPIEPVLTHAMSHKQVLTLKATCHAAFDSFWLGIQCSGIEAAAMQMPVIAGDRTVAERYVKHFGEVPYTFANDGDELETRLLMLMQDAEYYAAEQSRVYHYVEANHDEAAVALTYLDYLDERFGWRTAEKTRRLSRNRSIFTGVR